MEKQIAQFANRGMYQDTSVSKATNEFAFENLNVRITALNDNTLFTVTNERDSKELEVVIGPGYDSIQGHYLGHAVLNDTIILFSTFDVDRIYKLEYDKDEEKIIGDILYTGNLNFSTDYPIEALAYYESEDVQKVYWVDGLNYPRMINIKNVWKSSDDDTQFDFNPTVDVIPKVTIKKKYEGLGLFSSGVIQYFISYYDKYGTESAIAWASPLYYINYEDRGASPEDTVTCHFEIEIEGADDSYDNIRIYSLKRSSLNGEVQCNIVTSLEIPKDDFNKSRTFKFIDTNRNQELIDPNKLYFIGGNNFIASTLAQKDNTLFLGDIKLKSKTDDNLYSKIKEVLENSKKDSIIDGETIKESSLITFMQTKKMVLGHTDNYYYNNSQSKKASNTFKTFKRGELYRFAIQFQTKRGEWLPPIWIGDKKCDIIPKIDTTEVDGLEILKLSDIECNLSQLENETITSTNGSLTFKEALLKLFYSYRILMADTSNDRSIIAQGVVCPTLFNYDERCNNKPFSIASWIMRPRRGNAVWQHLNHANIEICGQDKPIAPAINIGTQKDEDGNPLPPDDGENLDNYDGILVATAFSGGKRLHVAIHNMVLTSNDDGSYNYNFDKLKLIKKTFIDDNSWKDVYYEFVKFVQDYIYDIIEVCPEERFVTFARAAENKGDPTIMGGSWVKIDTDEFLNHDLKAKIIPYELPNRLKNVAFLPVQSEKLYNTGRNDLNYDSKKNNYYVDNTVLTFHSPDVELTKDVLNNSDLEFRIVGITPITSSFSDVDIQLRTKGLSLGSTVNKSIIQNYPNISKKTTTLVSGPLYVDYDWVPIKVTNQTSTVEGFVPSTLHTNYNIFLWHKQGSLTGQNELTYKNQDGNNFDDVPADLKRKIFGTQRFSANTTYFNPDHFWKSDGISTVKYFSSDNIEIEQFKVNDSSLFYYGNYDKLLTYTEPYTQGKLQQYDPVRIKYKSSPHVIFSLQKGPFLQQLPKFGNETERLSSLYSISNDNPPLVWEKEEPVESGMLIVSGVYPEELVNDFPSFISFLENTLGIDFNNRKDRIKYGGTILVSPDKGSVDHKGILTKISKVGKFIWELGTDSPKPIDILYYDGDMRKFYGKSHNLLGNFDENPFYDIPDPFGIIYPERTINGVVYEAEKIKPIKGIHYIKNQSSLVSLPYDEGFSYLYMGELYRKLNYDSMYGGTSQDSLELINWIPITESVQFNSINSNLPKATNAEGDTYYQRWDCLKTYPYTEEDINSVVDITSFMVETHVNLEGRYDRNKGTTNILNIRPTNFNLMNKVYSQTNNFFTYNILDEKYNLANYKNQITWSLQKTPTAEIDVWTDISLASSLNLNGSYGKITKLINNNDTIIAFQDKAISAINFNNRTALSTENGVPIEIANSGKVDGYKVISDNMGCQNKQSIVKTASGLYFIDHYNKSLFNINSEGISNVSNNGMSVWFKNNIDYISELSYNSLTNDIYILGNNTSLVYNETLGNFTTLVDFITKDYSSIFNYNGVGLGFKEATKTILPVALNKGDYQPYKISYRVNPEPYLDKVFTNIEYIADLYEGTADVVGNPFEKLEALNDYQYGETLTSNLKYPNDYKKFRIWRMDIPRSNRPNKLGKNLDRIRSPWVKLTLSSDNPDKRRMEFHNLNVYYYK